MLILQDTCNILVYNMHSRLVDSQSSTKTHITPKTHQKINMDARNEAAAATNISTFEPSSDLIREEDCNTLLLYLPGFTKDQLRVQLTRTRVLKISGARPLTNNKTSNFQKDFPVPENCDTNRITAKFEDGILYVRQPKTLPPSQIQKQAGEPQQLPPKIGQPRTPTPNTTTQISDDRIKQAAAGPAARDSQKKPAESKEKSSKGEGDHKKPAEETTGGDGDDDHRRQKAAEKRDKGAGTSVESDYSKLSPAARLKAVKKKMTNIVLLLFVFALGIYFTKLPWFSKRAQD